MNPLSKRDSRPRARKHSRDALLIRNRRALSDKPAGRGNKQLRYFKVEKTKCPRPDANRTRKSTAVSQRRPDKNAPPQRGSDVSAHVSGSMFPIKKSAKKARLHGKWNREKLRKSAEIGATDLRVPFSQQTEAHLLEKVRRG